MMIRGREVAAALFSVALFSLAAAGRAQSQTVVNFGGRADGESVGVAKPPDPGPSPGIGESGINDYRRMDDQLNISPTDGVIRTIRTDQKRVINQFVTAVFPLTYAGARELRDVLRTITGLEGGRAEAVRNTTTGEQAIEVIAPNWMIPHLERAVLALDQPWIRTYEAGWESVYYGAQNRPAAGIDRLASNYASENGRSNLDPANNAVTRLDEPYRVEQYLAAAKIVDIPANEVILEVKIYEVASSNDLKLGLDYINWKNGPGRNLAQFVYTSADAQSRNRGQTSVFDPFLNSAASIVAGDLPEVTMFTDFAQFYRSVDYLVTSNFIDFLQVKGEARLVTEQTKTVKSANRAFFLASDEIVALVSTPGTASEIQGQTRPGVATPIGGARFSQPGSTNGQSVSFVENETGGGALVGQNVVPVSDSTRRLHYSKAGRTGLHLEVVPFVGLNSMELVIDLEVGDLNGVAPNGQPIINTRTVSTTVRLLDGEPYVIAGLKRMHDVKETAKVPFLGDIPLLGYLFGGEQDLKRWTDVVVVVTPHFILSSQTDIIKPRRVQNVADVAAGAPVRLPENRPGYDQWLLDPKN
jgi:type II secretory pathway component GspD/PulD (secretin)